MPDEIMDWTSDAYAQTVSVDCDLDLWPSDMVLTHDKLSHLADLFCQIIFKSHQFLEWSYGLDTILECTNLKHRYIHENMIDRLPTVLMKIGLNVSSVYLYIKHVLPTAVSPIARHLIV